MNVSRRARFTRPVLRFVASVLITSGLMLLADAALTVTWQEPVSAFLANREQDRLSDELRSGGPDLAADKRQVESVRDVRERLRRLARLQRRRARKGAAVGRLRLPSLDRRYVVVEGTDLGTLRKGPGHFPKTPFPGEGGTVAVAGHRTTYLAPFRTVDDLKRGDELVMEMRYGRFTYEVERTQIVPPDATWVTRQVRGGRERLVLTACHPLYAATERIVVFAKLVRAEPA